MIELTQTESSVYESIKRGTKDSVTLRLSLNKSPQAIRNAVLQLESYGMVEISRVGKFLFYKSIKKKYTLKKKKAAPKMIGDGIPRSTLDLSGYNITLSYEQLVAIEVYKKDKTYKGMPMERTQFAKTIGTPKLHVTFALEAMR